MWTAENLELTMESEGEPEAARDVKQVVLIAASLRSIQDIKGLRHFRDLRVLNLHSNDIQQIQGLEELSQLQEINMSSNQLRTMSGLRGLRELQTLNLASNKLQAVGDLEDLTSLRRLVLSYNRITDISGLAALNQPGESGLDTIDLRDNLLHPLAQLKHFRKCRHLRHLVLHLNGKSNPVCANTHYVPSIRRVAPRLISLDGAPPPTFTTPPGMSPMGATPTGIRRGTGPFGR